MISNILTLHEFRNKFDTYFNAYLTQKCRGKSVFTSFTDDTAFNQITEYSLTYAQGGKRIRPYLLYVWYQSISPCTFESIRDICVAFEMLQLFLLIHDDITDKWETRHHTKSYHRYLEDLYQHERAGISQALIFWDLLYTWVWELLHQCVEDGKAPIKILRHVSNMVQSTAYGQLIDIHLSYCAELKDISLITEKDTLKTVLYTFVYPFMIGRELWGGEESKEITAWTYQLGTIFQLRDDLLDFGIYPTDKTTFSDIQEGNQTQLTAILFERCTHEERTFVYSCMHKVISDTEKQKLLQLFIEYGIIEETKEKVNWTLSKLKEQAIELFWDCKQDVVWPLRNICEALKLT